MREDNSNPVNAVLPEEPIHRLTQPLARFLHIEAASGGLLLTCALAALALANSPLSSVYLAFWEAPFGITLGRFQLVHSLGHWVNDALMAIFFFVIGLEVKREIVHGELSEIRRATLPIAAAVGGMLVPAAIYLALQWGGEGQPGWGIPMATDIAFVVGCLAVLGPRAPAGLRVILLSLAIVDDVGAIIVIALGYTAQLHYSWLALGVAGMGTVLLMQNTGVRSIGIYTLVGGVVWLGFEQSGIHATIAGVALGLLTPARSYLDHGAVADLFRRASEMLHGDPWNEQRDRAEKVRRFRHVARETIPPLEYLIHLLHPWVAFLIMPTFALANAGFRFQPADVISPTALAVVLGLGVGKPLGVLALSWLALALRIATLPKGITWLQLTGGGFLAGIGFTMSLFISGLAFGTGNVLQSAKIGVLVGSSLSAVIGMTILTFALRPSPVGPSSEGPGSSV